MNKGKYGFVAGLLIAIAVVSLSLTGIYVNQREKGEQVMEAWL